MVVYRGLISHISIIRDIESVSYDSAWGRGLDFALHQGIERNLHIVELDYGSSEDHLVLNSGSLIGLLTQDVECDGIVSSKSLNRYVDVNWNGL